MQMPPRRHADHVRIDGQGLHHLALAASGSEARVTSHGRLELPHRECQFINVLLFGGESSLSAGK